MNIIGLLQKKLCRMIDVDDTEFVACNELIKGQLWTGDLKLIKGLQNQGYHRCINTVDLYNHFIITKKANKPGR